MNEEIHTFFAVAMGVVVIEMLVILTACMAWVVSDAVQMLMDRWGRK